jgi:WD40 repeat protein
MEPRIRLKDRDVWGIYLSFERNLSRWSGHADQDGDTEETLGVLEYAVGYPLARVRSWLSRAALRHWQRMQRRDAGQARSLVSRLSQRAAYLACITGEFGLARNIARGIADPADADYLGTRSEVCTPKQQHLAYAVRAFLGENRAATERELRQVRRGRNEDEETLQATMIRALLDPDAAAFLSALGQLLKLSIRRAKRDSDLADQILCVPALGLAHLAMERALITPEELPGDDLTFPVQLLSAECVAATKGSPSEVRRFLAHPGGVTCLAIGDRSLITGGCDNVIRVWDKAGHREIMALTGHREVVSAVAPLWEQDRLVSVSWDATVRGWNLQTGEAMACREPPGGFGNFLFSVESVVRIPSSDDVVIGFGIHDFDFGIWNVNRPKHLTRWGKQKGAILGLHMSADGRHLLAATDFGVLLLWDLGSKTLLRRFEGSDGPVFSALFHPSSPFVFSGGADAALRLWDLQSARCMRRFLGHRQPVRALCCTPDGKWLVSGGDDETIRVWNTATGEQALSLEGHLGTVRCLGFQDEAHLVSGGDDGTVRVWDLSGIMGKDM